MKNKFFGLSIFLFALSLGFVSCDVEPIDAGLEPDTSLPTQVIFAANYSGNHYSTNQASAEVANGQLKIQATNSNGTFLIHSLSALPGTYTNSQLEFKFIDNEGTVYSSIHPETQMSNSQLNIQSIDYSQKTITGTFQFVGYVPVVINDTVTIQEVLFSQGTFMNVPYANGITNPIDPEQPGQPGQPGGGGTSSGDYFPMAVGNKWEYSNLTELSEIVSTQTIEGNLYYRMTGGIINAQDLTEDAEDYVRKENGNYYAKVNYPSLGQSVEMIILKDYLNVGQSWNESFEIVLDDTPDEVTELTVTTTSTIEFKGSYTVNGVNYPDVIKVASEVSSELLYNGEPFGENEPPLLHEYWYAKDVGLIKLRIEETSDEPEELHELLDYELF